MRACGLGDGISELGGQQVLVKGNLATLADGTIAGSVLHMNDAVRNFAQNTTGNNVAGILPGDIAAPASINESKGELTAAGELYTGEVLAAATYNPARSINMSEYGNLAKGRPADIIIFDNNVRATGFYKTFNSCWEYSGESPYTAIKGEKVHLYERVNYPDNFVTPTTFGGCFESCSYLVDYENIPDDWITQD